jgi:hypothetical protein
LRVSVRFARRRWATLLLALPLALGVAGPSEASPETIRRAASNLLFGPFDFFLGPIVGARSAYYNIQDIDDSTGVRVAYLLPGVVWNAAMCMGGAVFRTLSGAIELVPGLLLIPFEADMDPLFAPAEKSDALIWEETDFITVKLGINYVE